MPTLNEQKKAKKRKLPSKDSEKQQQPKKKKKKTQNQNGKSNKSNGNSNNTNGNHNGSHKSTGISDSLQSVFHRVAMRRQKEISLLEPALVRGLLMDIRELTGTELPVLTLANSMAKIKAIKANQAADEVRRFVSKQYKTISDENTAPDKRRKAWEVVSEIFRLIDTLTGQNDDSDGDDSETDGIVQTKRSALANGKDTGKDTGKTQTSSGSGKAAATSARAATQSSATTTSKSSSSPPTTTTIHQESNKSATTTPASKNAPAADTNKNNSAGKGDPKSSAQSNGSSTQKKTPKSPVRTVASLSTASAMTTATALDSNNPSKSAINSSSSSSSSNNNKQPPAQPLLRGTAPSVPAGTAPPPYQKRSLTTQLHKNQKLQKQQEQQRKQQSNKTASNVSRPRANSDTTKKSPGLSAGAAAASIAATSSTISSAAVVSSSSSSTSPTSFSSTNTTNNNSETRPRGKTLRIQFPPIPEVTEKPIDSRKISKIWLPPDDSKTKPTTYGCFTHDRPRVEIELSRFEPTIGMTTALKRRLDKWDPYWVTEQHFCIGVTSPITKQTYDRGLTPPLYSPNTGAFFTIKDLTKIAGPQIRQVLHGKQPRDGEKRVIIRMLPLYLSKQKNGGKDRADVHLWPKGTYMQIGLPNGNDLATPQILYQRKQQSHDATKWLGICKHLDITSMVHQAYSSTTASLQRTCLDSKIVLGCYDKELYLFSLALCRYRSPQHLCTMLLEKQMLPTIGLQEMQDRAKKLMESNEVILDGDSDDDEDQGKTKELKSLRFSIRDPIQLAPLQNPVRGICCRHISCFDLGNYLDLNKCPSGQRWKCAHCENFLSFQDLERCALTMQASQQFGSQIGSLQHMVEFKEDGSMELCKRTKTHQERARAKKLAAAAAANKQQQQQSSHEVVELLDSDSD